VRENSFGNPAAIVGRWKQIVATASRPRCAELFTANDRMTKQLRWLHLSDIHFRGKSKLDQNDAFARIRTDLARRTAEGNGP
jgi:hypothetical protein